MESRGMKDVPLKTA